MVNLIIKHTNSESWWEHLKWWQHLSGMLAKAQKFSWGGGAKSGWSDILGFPDLKIKCVTKCLSNKSTVPVWHSWGLAGGLEMAAWGWGVQQFGISRRPATSLACYSSTWDSLLNGMTKWASQCQEGWKMPTWWCTIDRRDSQKFGVFPVRYVSRLLWTSPMQSRNNKN